MRTMDAAKGRWPGILMALGVDEQFLRNRHGECPMCGGHDRYRFDDNNGEGGYYCNSCGPGDGMKLLMGVTGKSFGEAAKAVDEIVGNVPMGAPKPAGPDPRVRLRKVAQSLQRLGGVTAVGSYLKARGLAPSPITQYCPRMPYYEDGQLKRSYPAMVHLFRGPDGDPLTYHITYLENDTKADVSAPKKILTPLGPMAGGAIRLYPESRLMGIAEGIETAIAASDRFGLPVWAAYSANLLEQWKPPAGVEEVWVFGDNDNSFTGQSSAYNLAKRLHREGLKVIVMIPETANTDFADEVEHFQLTKR